MKRAYRSIDFNNERKWKATHIVDDVLQVGKLKSIGYVIDNDNYIHKEFDIRVLAEQLFADNKLINVVHENNTTLLWVGDYEMMSAILHHHTKLLEQNGWPITPKEFLNRISVEHIDHDMNLEMYHVVCELFNSWCLLCETPIAKKFVDGSTRFISSNPYDPDTQ